MGFLADSQNGGGGGQYLSGFKGLIRRKQVDSVHSNSSSSSSGGHGQPQLAKELSISHLIAIGNFI